MRNSGLRSKKWVLRVNVLLDATWIEFWMILGPFDGKKAASCFIVAGSDKIQMSNYNNKVMFEFLLHIVLWFVF